MATLKLPNIVDHTPPGVKPDSLCMGQLPATGLANRLNEPHQLPVLTCVPNQTGRNKHKQTKEAELNGDPAHDYLKDVKYLTDGELKQNCSLTYSSWRNRKYNSKENFHPAFRDFQNFLRLMGPRTRPDLTLDRIDNSDPEYAPGKVRWADKTQQNNNQRQTTLLTHNNETLPLSEWARRTGQKRSTLHSRRRSGWDDSAVVTGRKTHRPAGTSRATSASGKEVSKLVDTFCSLVKDHHDRKFVSVIGKDRGLLRKFVDIVGANSTAVLEYAVLNWDEFCARAEKNIGAFKSPVVPTIDYLLRYRDEAVCMYLQEQLDQHPPQDWCQQRQAYIASRTKQVQNSEGYRRLEQEWVYQHQRAILASTVDEDYPQHHVVEARAKMTWYLIDSMEHVEREFRTARGEVPEGLAPKTVHDIIMRCIPETARAGMCTAATRTRLEPFHRRVARLMNAWK